MNRIIAEKQDANGVWVERPDWSENFDKHPEDMPYRALNLMVELDVGLNADLRGYRFRCTADSDYDTPEALVTWKHPDYDEMRHWYLVDNDPRDADVPRD